MVFLSNGNNKDKTIILFGGGGAYEITLKVLPYYRAHITYREDTIFVSADGELIDCEHIKTYPKPYFK
ncbi:DUF3888 domain-containing protein [Virgibacillus sp. W0181]|uniref:DUF3888 domain-containing protein n=1 Tax=Virgibacillus sp. W0181 TaxID=3391581 RepID=UPI003F4602C7